MDRRPPADGRFDLDFSQITVFANATARIQPKLMVNAPGDIYEQEADRLAQQVLRVPGPRGAAHKHLQRQHVRGDDFGAVVTAPIVRSALHSPGQPLSQATLGFMEPRFGFDLSRVRIHTDVPSARSAQAVNARAFTVGKDVVFGRGEFAPETSAGKQLLAHELTHVIQQQTGTATLQRKTKDVKDNKDKPALKITGVIAAGGELSDSTIAAVNEAAKQVPNPGQRHYVAYEPDVKVGGDLNWRANNPGNLRRAETKIATVPGETGVFAVFATMDAGRLAQRAIYLNQYGDEKVRDAASKLTPPKDKNNTPKYLADLEKAGIDLDSTMKSQIDKLMPAIESLEGMKEGIDVQRTE